MGVISTLPCCGEKLKSLLERRGLTMQTAGLEMGRSKGYIFSCIKRGTISSSAAQQLKVMYNIRPEDYAPETEEEPSEPEDDRLTRIEGMVTRILAVTEKLLEEWNG